MQEGVSIVEDVPLGYGIIIVVVSEFGQCPIGDVLSAIRAILVIGVKGKALGITCKVEIWNRIDH